MNLIDFDSPAAFALLLWDSILQVLLNTAHMVLAPETMVQHLAQVLVIVFLLLVVASWVADKDRFTDYDDDTPFLTEEEIVHHLDSL